MLEKSVAGLGEIGARGEACRRLKVTRPLFKSSITAARPIDR